MSKPSNPLSERQSFAAGPSRLVMLTFHALASATTEEQADAILADFTSKAKPGDWADLETKVLDEFAPSYIPLCIKQERAK